MCMLVLMSANIRNALSSCERFAWWSTLGLGEGFSQLQSTQLFRL
jgi:hypothetical protein